MSTVTRLAAVMIAGALLLTGCASSHHTTDAPAHSPPHSTAMSPGMIMPDGSTMSAEAPAAEAAAASGPSAAEKMICAAETRADITKILGFTATPSATATWANHRYTCTYTLPMGTFIVSVTRSTNPTAAKAYYTSLRTTLGTTTTLDGLGQGSYGTPGGKVVLIKDSDTLMVDASRLPTVFGAQQSKRFDFAYEIATDILGCWTGG